MSKKIGSIVLILVSILLLISGYRYIDYRVKNAVSDAAFIKSDNLPLLSFKVGGRVINMLASENQRVKKGELLALIDTTDFKLNLERLEHKSLALDKKIEALKLKKSRLEKVLNLQSQISATDIEALDDEIDSIKLQIKAYQIRLEKLKKDKERFSNMLSNNLIPKGDYETIQSKSDSLAKQIESMDKKLLALKSKKKKALLAYKLSKVNEKEIKELEKSIEASIQDKKALLASIKEVKKSIEYAKLYAPFNGVIAKKFFDAPKVVAKGYPVYALVDTKNLYCQVLLSERKLRGVRVGNRATIKVDAIKGKTFKGKVESIAPTSASTFSLVPRDIASGEFTKLDQRFIVRIKLDSIEGLRSGMGASVAIKRSVSN